MLFAFAPLWNDALAVVSLLIGVVGFAYTIYQVRITKRAAVAAREAADQALAESRLAFRRYVAANAHRLLNEARQRVVAEEWQAAAILAAELADQLGQVGQQEAALRDCVAALRDFERQFVRLATGNLRRLQGRPWANLVAELQPHLDRLRALFPAGEGGEL